MRKINSPFELNGKGLHSGKDCSVKIEPCKSDFIIMRSYESEQELPINQFKTQGTGRGSDYIFENGTKIRTCEHVLSGLTGLGVFKDAKITVKGGEMPALDGCSHEISSEILKHSEEIESDNDFLSCNSLFVIHDEKNKSRFIAYFPDSGLDTLLITYAVEYEVVGAEIFDFEYTSDNYYNQISNARTFALYSDVEILRKNGMALGGTLENAILIDNVNNKITASGGLRWQNEFVRHKILDLIGDLASVGKPLKGHILAVKAGHELHLKFAERIKKK